MKHPKMDGKCRKDCIHIGGEYNNECNHPKRGCWHYCDTMHIEDFDGDSCQAGWYQTNKPKVKQMKLKGIFKKAATPVKTDEPFYLRLVEASSYPGSVAVEAVDKEGNRISLICRISKEKGIETYKNVKFPLGFPLGKDDSVVVQTKSTV